MGIRHIYIRAGLSVPLQIFNAPSTSIDQNGFTLHHIADLEMCQSQFADFFFIQIFSIDIFIDPVTKCRDPVSDRKRSEEHTSELQSRGHLVCRLLLEKKKYQLIYMTL